MLVGSDPQRIVAGVTRLLHDDDAYRRMCRVMNPYGDGRACQRIVDALVRHHTFAGDIVAEITPATG
jgi:UDP-N-acetylglucosamine 2-epimerase